MTLWRALRDENLSLRRVRTGRATAVGATATAKGTDRVEGVGAEAMEVMEAATVRGEKAAGVDAAGEEGEEDGEEAGGARAQKLLPPSPPPNKVAEGRNASCIRLIDELREVGRKHGRRTFRA